MTTVTTTNDRTTTTDRPTDDACWQAVIGRADSAVGRFFYAVRSTGVYCRPNCGARRPLRENVSFYRSCAEAERAGYRACKRCRPNQPLLAQRHQQIISAACRAIEAGDKIPDLARLAETAQMSRYHFHRLFKTITGVTPKAYATAVRRRELTAGLLTEGSVTDALYGSGFNSSGSFYASSNRLLGMTPSQFRDQGQGETIRFAVGECSLGSLLVAATATGVCAIFLGDDPEALTQDLENRFRNATLVGADRDFEQLMAQVVSYIDVPTASVNLPLDIRGTAFQQQVWQALQEIPSGTTVNYSDLASRIGSPKACRAVAQACGANPVAVVIPCHRVVRRDGGLGGYRWGIERKRQLLARENQESPE
jgi:AraC family transcriptional regulator of adaptative response/methylated-DNA-[protein]-cysteine methyltransferase